MATIATNKFRIHNAKSFVEGFSEAATSNMYLFIGKYSEWTSSDVSSGATNDTDDTKPPTPPDHVQNVEYQAWRHMIAAKRIQSTDVKHVIPRYNWTTGTVYKAYTDDRTTLHTDGTNPFYVLTDEFNVYKCIFTPFESGALKASTTKPTGTGTSLITTADGYVWKYMYTISASNALKFVTTSYIPVETLASDPGASACSQEDLQWTVQQAAIDGAIHSVKRKNDATGDAGSSYKSYSHSDIGTISDGDTEVDLSGNGGSAPSGLNDYYKDMVLYVNNTLYTITGYVGSTTTATVTPAMSSGDSGKTYTVTPKVNLTGGDGSNFTAVAVMSGNTIDSVEVLTEGTGYTKGTITFTDAFIDGVGTSASYVAVISPKGGHGKDPIKELGGFFVLMNTRLEYDEGVEKLTVANDYRQIGVVKDPLKADGNLATDSVYLQTVALPLDAGFGTFTLDETVTGGNSEATGTVVDQLEISGVQYVRLSNIVRTFQANETITGSSGATADVLEAGPTGAELKNYSGEIVYLENRKPITRDVAQLEDLKIILEF